MIIKLLIVFSESGNELSVKVPSKSEIKKVIFRTIKDKNERVSPPLLVNFFHITSVDL